MKFVKTLALLSVAATALLAQDAAQLLEQKCGSCHIVSNPTIENVKHMKAPPMWGVARNLIRHFKDEKAFVDFVVDYALNPSENKIVLDRAAKERFGLMPSMKGVVTKEELEAIAKYMYNHY
ncbi:c-type cytochrome [Hydrogenimonas sp.]